MTDNNSIINSNGPIDNINIDDSTHIKNSIDLNQTHGWWATLSDWLSNFIYGGNPKYAVINKNSMLSEKLTSMFNNSTVDVYIYDSKIVNCFTMVGKTVVASPLWVRMRDTHLGDTINFIGSFERMIQLIQIKASKNAGKYCQSL